MKYSVVTIRFYFFPFFGSVLDVKTESCRYIFLLFSADLSQYHVFFNTCY